MGPVFLPLLKTLLELAFLDSQLYWLVIVPECQEHTGNGTLVAVISLSGTRRNHRGLNETNKESRMFLTVKSCSTGQAVGIGTLL